MDKNGRYPSFFRFLAPFLFAPFVPIVFIRGLDIQVIVAMSVVSLTTVAIIGTVFFKILKGKK